MVIYFTGTGNSRYVAEAIADRLKDTVVCSNALMKKERKGFFHNKKPLIFVFPVYLSTIAEIFADFIRKSRFDGNPNAYFIATCASAMGATPNLGTKLCQEKHLNYMGAAMVKMPQNYIALFTMMDQEECARRQKAALTKVDEICRTIQSGQKLEAKSASVAEDAVIKLVEKMYNGPFTKTNKFYATDACVGCALCARNCPMNRITMQDGKPKWSGSCIHCMSCINRCPKQAIEYGKNTIGKTRYVCEKYRSC